MSSKSRTVCISGLGQVGLPLACLVASSGFDVTGVDTNKDWLKLLSEGMLEGNEKELGSLLKQALDRRKLKLSSVIEQSDVHIIAVPTLLTHQNQPDISRVYQVVETILPVLRPHDLVIIESTCPIGTTEKISRTMRAHTPLLHIAHCPERVLPGSVLNELINNDRVIGGVNETSTLKAEEFYATFIKGNILKTTSRMAEAVKLAENSFRDVNIAFANEISMLMDQFDLNTNELIRLANRHPRVDILKPGPGVGGHCLSVDPWFLIDSKSSSNSLISRAREVNTLKIDWVVDKVKASLKNKDDAVACLGLSYKANVSSLDASPALEIVKRLEMDTNVIRVDPFVKGTEPISKALSRSQIVVGLVAHDEFKNIPCKYLENKIVLDFAGVFE